MLFSDIEGSTSLLSRLGDKYSDALDVQRSVLRSAWRRWGGVEMGTEGDSFFVVFELARDAVHAAVEAQRDLASQDWPGGEGIAVRMGLHTGEPVAHDGGYVGMDVHRAARVSAAAHGGQVVLTAATSELVGESLPDGAALVDLGWHRLKDFAAPMHVYQVNASGLPDSFPPLKTLGTASSLPPETTPLVGRDRELRDLHSLLHRPDVRLVTLTGTGGSGKTRLATALASDLAVSFSDGVFFVPLAGVETGQDMWSEIIDTLDAGGESRSRSRFLAQLAGRHLLLVLDNLEQIPDAGEVVDEILRSAGDLVVIATSRRPLHVRGEHEHPVPPLELPKDDQLTSVAESAAAQLFCKYAQMVRPRFTLTDENAADIAAIVRRLDGLPLALELAAARAKLLSPGGLLSRLGSTVELGGHAAGRPERQQTMRDTITWSYNLLTTRQQAVFRRLGVFSGGADLEAVSAIAHVGIGLDPLETVAAFVDLSLVSVAESSEGDLRVNLLQTVDDFAVELLTAAGEFDEFHALHAEYYLALAENLAPDLWTGKGLAARRRLQIESDNFRAALNWALYPNGGGSPTPDQVMASMRMTRALHVFWLHHGHIPESRRWMERVLAVDSGADRPERVGVLISLAELSDAGAGDPRPRAWVDEAMAISRRLDYQPGICDALREQSFLAMRAGSYDEASELLEQSIDVARRIEDPVRLGYAIHRFGWLEHERGHHATSIALFEESQALARRRGDETSVVFLDIWIANSQISAGQLDEATQRLERVAADITRVSHQSLNFSILSTYAHLLAALGDAPSAATLLGAHWAHYTKTGSRIEPESEEAWLQRTGLGAMRERLGRQRWQQALDNGGRMTLEEALNYANEAVAAASATSPA
jgi:predicted ATPase/class 3 adenylate cyclase